MGARWYFDRKGDDTDALNNRVITDSICYASLFDGRSKGAQKYITAIFFAETEEKVTVFWVDQCFKHMIPKELLPHIRLWYVSKAEYRCEADITVLSSYDLMCLFTLLRMPEEEKETVKRYYEFRKKRRFKFSSAWVLSHIKTQNYNHTLFDSAFIAGSITPEKLKELQSYNVRARWERARQKYVPWIVNYKKGVIWSPFRVPAPKTVPTQPALEKVPGWNGEMWPDEGRGLRKKIDGNSQDYYDYEGKKKRLKEALEEGIQLFTGKVTLEACRYWC